ncbi:cytochrome P450 [Nocardioides litoris]|uniref:cytochrome P450 n=1 Tax=Nocardioides litoris TaxID=1926648 RepID=UPI0011244807|nr:cytochrome P450 [Nocardioides litoris]
MDLALRLRRDGYAALDRDRQARGGGTTYASRLLARRAVVLGGEEGARVFYDESVVERKGAVPPPLGWLLFGRGAVHSLDGGRHRTRKAMFTGRLGPEQVAACAALARERLEASLPDWDGSTADLHDRLAVAYGGAVLTWVGIDLDEDERRAWSRRYARIVGGFGFAGPRLYARAWRERTVTDRWARRLVTAVRAGELAPPEGSVLATIAATDLDDSTAAVELGNVVRPTIAVAWLGVHAAAALAGLPPQERALLAETTAEDRRWAFAEEVRRTTPFVPALAGRVRRRTKHGGVDLRVGDFVVLDVRGIDLDERHYPDPTEFRADRFAERRPTPYDLVPQGGGPLEGHRCPGESMTLQLLVQTTAVLAEVLTGPEASTPDPDLGRIPTLPRLGLYLSVARPGTRRS